MPVIDVQHGETTEVGIRVAGGALIAADVTIPPNAAGTILFAHGSGSGRHSTRNQYVASELNKHRFATVLADLLTTAEERIDARTSHLRFDIPFLSQRVVQLIDWVQRSGVLATPPLGLFGASTGAAAALDAAALRPDLVRAVVSRGGRPDLASNLDGVKAPTLFIVGSEDGIVVDLNRDALRALRGVKQLEIVPGATHLFEEPGKLETVAALASAWFTKYLTRP